MDMQTPDRAVRLAVELVNTRTRDPEKLRSPADLRRFLLGHGEPEPVDVTRADLAEMIAVRERHEGRGAQSAQGVGRVRAARFRKATFTSSAGVNVAFLNMGRCG